MAVSLLISGIIVLFIGIISTVIFRYRAEYKLKYNIALCSIVIGAIMMIIACIIKENKPPTFHQYTIKAYYVDGSRDTLFIISTSKPTAVAGHSYYLSTDNGIIPGIYKFDLLKTDIYE